MTEQQYVIPDVVVREVGSLHLQLAAVKEQLAAKDAEIAALRQQLESPQVEDEPEPTE